MTLTQFLEELRKTPRKWRLLLRHDGEAFHAQIRMRPNAINCDCPITEVARRLKRRRVWTPGFYGLAAKAIGLRRDTADRIAAAADQNDYPRLRKRLLAACGIEEGESA